MELLGFYQPTDIEQTKTLLSELKKAKILAGGTDLIISIHKKGIIPEYLIDLSHVSELKNIEEGKNYISIGSMVTFSQMKESKLIGKHYNSLYECTMHMGSPQVRNTATIGGNIVNAGSAADIIPCILAHEGILVIESKTKSRKVSCRDYFNHYSDEKVK
jgi:CO/xanthine dehydrogenase FAD-binding subunit